jgi:hypothetical protein
MYYKKIDYLIKRKNNLNKMVLNIKIDDNLVTFGNNEIKNLIIQIKKI